MTVVGKLTIGEAEFPILDAGLPAVFVDCLVEAREIGGVINIGLGSIVVDGDGPPRCNVSARLRMNLGVAQDLARVLLNLTQQNAEAKEKAN